MSLSMRMPVDVPTGWECPRCHRVYAPRVEQCLPCSPPTLFAGPLPRPEPRRFPHPVGGFSGDSPRWHPLTETLDTMAEVNAGMFRRIGGDWRGVLPGVECRMTGGATVEAVVEFRVAPPAGCQAEG